LLLLCFIKAEKIWMKKKEQKQKPKPAGCLEQEPNLSINYVRYRRIAE
jgi:hypothetical protein